MSRRTPPPQAKRSGLKSKKVMPPRSNKGGAVRGRNRALAVGGQPTPEGTPSSTMVQVMRDKRTPPVRKAAPLKRPTRSGY